jgi:hypothetical protein
MQSPVKKLTTLLLIAVAMTAITSAKKHTGSNFQRTAKFNGGQKNWLRKFMMRNVLRKNERQDSSQYLPVRTSIVKGKGSGWSLDDAGSRAMRLGERGSGFLREEGKRVKISSGRLILRHSSITIKQKNAQQEKMEFRNSKKVHQSITRSAENGIGFKQKHVAAYNVLSEVQVEDLTPTNQSPIDDQVYNENSSLSSIQKKTHSNPIFSKAAIDIGDETESSSKSTYSMENSSESQENPSASIEFSSHHPNSIYEAGDFNNLHISQLLMAVADIDLYFTNLFSAFKFPETDSHSQPAPSQTHNAHQEALISTCLRDSPKVEESIGNLEQRIESIHLNFHNVLDFFGLKNDFEDIKIKTGFDHNVLEDMEERLLKEVDATGEKFRALSWHLLTLGMEYKNLVSFIKKAKALKSTDITTQNLSHGRKTAKQLGLTFKRLRFEITNSLKGLKDQIFLIKQQKLVFDRVFNESKNAIQISRTTNGNWIYPITVVLITVSTALLI